MRLLITRPEPEASAFAAALTARGHRVLIAPLQSVQFHVGARVDLDGIAAILATSANGVRALANRCARRDILLFAVGPQTARAAHKLGFAKVESADGDKSALTGMLQHRFSAGTALLHATGSNGTALVVPGCDVRRAELYDVIAAEHLPSSAADAMKAGALDGAFFFSPGGAKVFAACVEKDGLHDDCRHFAAYCISAAAAKSLAPLRFAQIFIAGKPNRAALLDMLPV
jgi:uroporphyrinogen-III synthase